MPYSKAELIAQAIVTLLTVPPLSGMTAQDVLRDPLDAIDSATFPKITVETGNEDVPTSHVLGIKNRAVEIHVSVLTAGATPLVSADPIASEAAGRILAAPTLGGLSYDLDEGPTLRATNDLGEGTARITMTFQVRYRTTETSKEA
jgi:hypothetical protein